MAEWSSLTTILDPSNMSLADSALGSSSGDPGSNPALKEMVNQRFDDKL